MLLRLKYAKTAEGRYLSHLDLLRTMERVFRRAELPLAYSEGFNPHPRVSYGSALSVGTTSEGEYLDIELRREMAEADVRSRLAAVMPPALQILDLKTLRDRKGSLTALINLARYRVTLEPDGSVDQVMADKLAEQVLAESDCMISRFGKKGEREINIRPGIYLLKAYVHNRQLVLEMDVQTGSEGNVKPEEVVRVLEGLAGMNLSRKMRVHRLGLFVTDGENVLSPMEKD